MAPPSVVTRGDRTPVAAAAQWAFVALLLAGCGGSGVSAPYQRFRSRPDLRPPPVKVLARARGTAPGYLFVAPKKDVAQNGPLILDGRGRVVWFLPLDAPGVADFRVQTYRGRPVLTWWHGGRRPGYSIYDDSYRQVAEVRPGHGLVADMHEFLLTARGSALLTFDRKARVGGRTVIEGGVQEVDVATGRVLFEWHSLDHVPLAESYVRPPRDQHASYDYFHVNSIEPEPDGNLLVSARNTHTVYELDRRTGGVLWRLGGKRSDFALGPGARFAWQHDARLHAGGTLTLFDNAAAPKTRPESRGLVLRLDRKRMRATLVRQLVHRPPLVAVDQGNLQALPNGDFLVGWGHEPYVTEFGPRGDVRLDLRFGAGRVDSYRAYRFPWTGRPRDRPTVAVAGRSVYVSWNGATEVARWQLLGGRTRDGLRPLRTVPRRGFETRIGIPSGAAYVAVRALDRRGSALGRSRTECCGGHE